MSITWTPGIKWDALSTRSLIIPTWEDTPEIIKKSGGNNFTSYFIPSHSIMRPSVMRLQSASDNKLYEASPIQVMYQLPDKGRRTIMLKIIDNLKVVCDAESECKAAQAGTEVTIEVKLPTFDLFVSEDEASGYIDTLIGTLLELGPGKKLSADAGDTYITDWSRLLKGSTTVD